MVAALRLGVRLVYAVSSSIGMMLARKDKHEKGKQDKK